MIERVVHIMQGTPGWTFSLKTGRFEYRENGCSNCVPTLQVSLTLVDRMVCLGRASEEIAATLAAFRSQDDVDEMERVVVEMERRRG